MQAKLFRRYQLWESRMNEVLSFLFGYGYLTGLFVGVALAGLVWFALGLVAPRLLVLPILLTLAVFPASSLLAGEGGIGFDVYGKGAGYLFFSVYEYSIAAVAMGVALRGFFSQSLQQTAWRGAAIADAQRPRNTLFIYYWLMFALLLGHMLATLDDPREAWFFQLSRSGVVYLLLQGMLIAALLGAIDSPRVLQQVTLLVAAAVGLRMLWGMVRYLFLGGDPQSYYESGGITLKITFWDINDSVWAMMLAAGAFWAGATTKRWPQGARIAVWLLGLMCLGVIALSARRTAQGGAMLGILMLALLLPKGKRWYMLLVFVIILPVTAYKLGARLDDNRSWFQRIFNAEQSGQYLLDPRRQRFYELQSAMETVAQHPVFGVGPAGSFNPRSHVGLEYHKGNYGFVHSGFVHVLLKMGVVGLLVFCGLLGAYLLTLWRQWRDAPAHYRGYLAVSACGFAASLPNLVFGTPMIEGRTMLLLGVVMALPVLVARMAWLERQPVAQTIDRRIVPRWRLAKQW